jgi:cytoskeletal protein CcmA (bactofilin family)
VAVPVQLAVIPRETRVDGLIETPHDLLVEGQVDGRIQVGGSLMVARGATCRASVRARSAVVSGEIFGDLVCSSTIAVAAGGRVVGDLRAPEIDIDAAAEVDGRVDLLPPAPASAPLRRVEVKSRGPGVRRPMPPLPVTEIGHRG